MKKTYSAKWLLNRECEGFSQKLLREIVDEDTKLYKEILRMKPSQFEDILQLVSGSIKKMGTNFRKSISPAERLQVTLVYLATGLSQTFLQIIFRIGQSTISRILKETVAAIYNVLRVRYLEFPKNENDWRKIADDYFEKWGFPHCLGSLDGKHCKIKSMRKFGSVLVLQGN